MQYLTFVLLYNEIDRFELDIENIRPWSYKIEMKKKILFVSGSLERGGAQRVITLLANDYAKLGWSVHLIVMLDDEIGYTLDSTITVHKFVHRGNQLKNAGKWIKEIRQCLKNEKPDAIVSFVGRINMLTMLAAIGLNIPVLVSERNDPVKDRRNKAEQWLCKKIYAKADKVVFQTKYQADYYAKYCKTNSAIIGNPISAPIYEGKHPKKDIICVGKLMAQKNHPMIIRAFAQIAEQFPDKQVFIYGEGSKRTELQQQIDAAGLTERIYLCGNSEHIFDIMHEYEYFVMCSDYEGLSNAFLEAMISGMICVTTMWKGVEDIVQDGVNGYTVPVGDADALAQKIKKIFDNDDNDNEKIRAAGIAEAKEFEMGRILMRWRKEIDELVEGRN